MAKSAAKRVEELRAEIRKHDHAYFVLDKPTIADYDYDQLFQKLKDLEAAHPELITDDSPTQRVGGEPVGQFEKTKHRRAMVSLANSYSVEELAEFDERVRKFLDLK